MTDTKKTKGGLAMLMASEPEEMPTIEQPLTPEPEPDEGGTYISVPKGFQPPEDKQMGQEFTGTYRGYMMEDGRLCLTAVNEMPLDGSDTPADASGTDLGGENPDTDGAAVESTPEVKETKKLKAMLNGR